MCEWIGVLLSLLECLAASAVLGVPVLVLLGHSPWPGGDSGTALAAVVEAEQIFIEDHDANKVVLNILVIHSKFNMAVVAVVEDNALHIEIFIDVTTNVSKHVGKGEGPSGERGQFTAGDGIVFKYEGNREGGNGHSSFTDNGNCEGNGTPLGLRVNKSRYFLVREVLASYGLSSRIKRGEPTDSIFLMN